MFYIARGLAAWFVAGQQLTGWPEGYNLLGRKVNDILLHYRISLPDGLLRSVAEVVSVQTDLDAARRARRRRRARLHAVRAEGLRHRRQHPRRRLCRHQHQPGALPRAAAGGALRHHGRDHQRRLFPQLQPGRRPVPRARRHRRGDHRRRLDLRRLRHHDRRARRRGGDHPGPGAAAAQRPGLHHAAALDQRLHRRHPDRGGADRHLGAPGQPLRPPARPPRPAPNEQRKPPMPDTPGHPDRRDARHRQGVRRRAGAAATSTSCSIPARSSASSATTRPASRR